MGKYDKPILQILHGLSDANKANKEVFITTSGFNKNARSTASNVTSKIVLIDGPMLAELMMDFGLGVSPDQYL